MHGRTTSMRPRPASSTTRTTCPPQACRSFRPRWPTSTRSAGRPPSTSRTPNRGPLLVIAGTKDNTAPIAFTHGTYKHQSKNEGVTEYAEVEDRGHSLTLDHGWPAVADIAVAFVKRFV